MIIGQLMRAIADWRLGKIDGDGLLMQASPLLIRHEQETGQTELNVPVYLLAWLATIARSELGYVEDLKPVFAALEAGDLQRANSLVWKHTLGGSLSDYERNR
jgi:hypothetical protein